MYLISRTQPVVPRYLGFSDSLDLSGLSSFGASFFSSGRIVNASWPISARVLVSNNSTVYSPAGQPSRLSRQIKLWGAFGSIVLVSSPITSLAALLVHRVTTRARPLRAP